MSNENAASGTRSQTSFQLGELILARSPTLPFWPAFIQLCESKDDELVGKWRTQLSDGTDSRYWCVFVNTKDKATWVSTALVKKFTQSEADASISQCRADNTKERLTVAIEKAIKMRDDNKEKSVTAVLKPAQNQPQQPGEEQGTAENAKSSTSNINVPVLTTNSPGETKQASKCTVAQPNDSSTPKEQNPATVPAEQPVVKKAVSGSTNTDTADKAANPDVVVSAGNVQITAKDTNNGSTQGKVAEEQPQHDVVMVAPNESEAPPRVEEKEKPPDPMNDVDSANPITTRSKASVVQHEAPAPMQGVVPAVSRDISVTRNALPLPGDLVLAKTGTYPYWPAIVARCESDKKHWNNQWVLVATKKRPLRVWCSFVGDTTGGWVPLERVRPYNPQHAEELLSSQNARMYKDQKLAIALANEMHDKKKRLKAYPDVAPTPQAEAENNESNQNGNGGSAAHVELEDTNLKYRLGDIVLAKYDHSCPYWPAVIEKCNEVKKDEGEDESLLGKWHRKAVGNISDRYCCLFINDGSESWVPVDIILPFSVHRAKKHVLNRTNELYDPQRVAIEQAAVMHKKRGNNTNWSESDVVLAGFENGFWPAIIKKCTESEDSHHGQWKKSDEKNQALVWCAFLLNATSEWILVDSLKQFTAARARHYFVSKTSKNYKYQKDAISLATKLVEGKVFGDDVLDAEDRITQRMASAASDGTSGGNDSVQVQPSTPAPSRSRQVEEVSYVQFGVVLVHISPSVYWPSRIEPCPEDDEKRWRITDEATGTTRYWCNLLSHATSKWTSEEELKPFKPHRARRYMVRKTSAEIHDQRKAVKMATELQKKPEYSVMFNIPPREPKEPEPVKEKPAAVENVVPEKQVSANSVKSIDARVPKPAAIAPRPVDGMSTDPKIKEKLMAKVAVEKDNALQAFESRKRPAPSSGDTLPGSPPAKQIRLSPEIVAQPVPQTQTGNANGNASETARAPNPQPSNATQDQTNIEPKNVNGQSQKVTEKTPRDPSTATGKRMRVEVVEDSGTVKKRK